jgi:hypothetical protein
MFRLSIVLGILAFGAGLFAFNYLASSFGDIALMALYILLGLFAITLLLGLLTSRRVAP